MQINCEGVSRQETCIYKRSMSLNRPHSESCGKVFTRAGLQKGLQSLRVFNSSERSSSPSVPQTPQTLIITERSPDIDSTRIDKLYSNRSDRQQIGQRDKFWIVSTLQNVGVHPADVRFYWSDCLLCRTRTRLQTGDRQWSEVREDDLRARNAPRLETFPCCFRSSLDEDVLKDLSWSTTIDCSSRQIYIEGSWFERTPS